MKILWLASWYPSRIEPFNGDFVQRHAEAASLYDDIHVIHVIKDPTGIITKDIHIERRSNARLEEWVVYYHNRFQSSPILGRLFSGLTYWKVYQRVIAAYLREHGKPDLVHVHVCMKAGLLAWWMKRKFDLPYIVTEHSTIFLREAEENIFQQPVYYRKICAAVLKKASAVTVVSDHLGKALQAFIKYRAYVVIPNVVNRDIFFPAQKSREGVFQFIHISSLGFQKNFETILEAMAILKTKRTDFILRVFGPQNKDLRQKVSDAGLASFVVFHEEIAQPQLAGNLQNADALILFSRYETFGCVLIEAAACGVPVIVNDIPPMREIVEHSNNGLIVKNNVEDLVGGLLQLMEKKALFDSVAIAKGAKKYDYKTVGKSFSALYNDLLNGVSLTTTA